jgi:hypothetical protein
MPAIRQALVGALLTDHHCFVIRQALDHIDYLHAQMAQLDERIAELLKPYQVQFELLQTMPGIRKDAAAAILAEIGPDMGQFATAAHLASWAGLCPANNESAGKHRAGKSRKGNQWLGATLNQCAWAASVKKGCNFGDRFRRIAARRGKKRAIVAIAHAQLVIIYNLLSTRQPYEERPVLSQTYVAVLHRLAGLNVMHAIFRSMHQASKCREVSSGPLSIRRAFGTPRWAMTSSRARVTRRLANDVSVSRARHSRVKLSTTLKIRTARPVPSASLTKSKDHS